MKFIYVGDLHLRGTNPRNRLDDYKETVKRKLLEVFKLAEYHDVKAVLCAGDIFDRPEVTTAVLLEFVEVFKSCPVPFLTTAGNHDIYGYNLDTYYRTSLRLLELLVPQVKVINNPQLLEKFEEAGTKVQVSFTPYSGLMDKEGYGYSPTAIWPNAYRIHIAHGMLLDHEPPFDRYTYIGDVETEADLILTGHDHIGYGIFPRKDAKTFVNCGSLTRLAASASEIERPIQVALIEVKGQASSVSLIPLQSAKPGTDVLDRSGIEADQKRAYAMEQFAALIQTQTGEKVAVDIESIVENIGKVEGASPEIIQLALKKIEEARAAVV